MSSLDCNILTNGGQTRVVLLLWLLLLLLLQNGNVSKSTSYNSEIHCILAQLVSVLNYVNLNEDVVEAPISYRVPKNHTTRSYVAQIFFPSPCPETGIVCKTRTVTSANRHPMFVVFLTGF